MNKGHKYKPGDVNRNEQIFVAHTYDKVSGLRPGVERYYADMKCGVCDYEYRFISTSVHECSCPRTRKHERSNTLHPAHPAPKGWDMIEGDIG